MKLMIILLGGGLMMCSTLVIAESKSLTQKMLKPVIQQQCQQELRQSKAWYTATFLLSEQKKIAHQVCDCVGEHALDDIQATDLAKGIFSTDAKKQLMNQAIKNSISMCIPALIS